MRLTKPQLEALKDLPCTMSPDYKPIKALVVRGLAHQATSGVYGNPRFDRTPEGDKVLSELEKA